jgi:hypothetical protein
MRALDLRIRRARIRWRWTASALSALAVAAAITFPLAFLSSGTRIMQGAGRPPAGSPQARTDTAATPRGWAPVAYGAAQISVPSGWELASSPVCGRAVRGYVVIGTTATSLAVRNPRCEQAPNMAAIQVLRPGQGQTHRRSGYVNGIPVLGGQPAARGYAAFLAPTLHVLITVRGPLASKVLGTLTRSPLSVVIGSGPHHAVPRSWAWHSFLGVSFAAPGGWALVRNGHWGCPYFTASATVVLIPAANFQRPRCPVVLPKVGLAAPRSGMVVGVGLDRAAKPGYDGCRMMHGLRACYQESPFNGGLLEVQVFLPGRQRTTLVQIGLAGSGLIARTIFESIRPS